MGRARSTVHAQGVHTSTIGSLITTDLPSSRSSAVLVRRMFPVEKFEHSEAEIVFTGDEELLDDGVPA